jgi:hypothetical protein
MANDNTTRAAFKEENRVIRYGLYMFLAILGSFTLLFGGAFMAVAATAMQIRG